MKHVFGLITLSIGLASWATGCTAHAADAPASTATMPMGHRNKLRTRVTRPVIEKPTFWHIQRQPWDLQLPTQYGTRT